jgi:mannose-6-phosphate isomerase-like protein (cupin superfamily)
VATIRGDARRSAGGVGDGDPKLMRLSSGNVVGCTAIRPKRAEGVTMAESWTLINLEEIEDAAPGGGFGERWEARVAGGDLGAEQTGLSYFRLRPGRRSPFSHRHREAEEVYVVRAGTGFVKLGEEIRPVRPLDAIRIAPAVPRAFEAGPDGLELIVFGRHYEGDGEPVDDDWVR